MRIDLTIIAIDGHINQATPMQHVMEYTSQLGAVLSPLDDGKGLLLLLLLVEVVGVCTAHLRTVEIAWTRFGTPVGWLVSDGERLAGQKIDRPGADVK